MPKDGRSQTAVVSLPIGLTNNLTSLACVLKPTTSVAKLILAFPQHLLASSTKSPDLQVTPLFLPSKIIPRILLRPLSALTPRNPTFRKRLDLRLQGSLMQRQVVYLSNPHDRHTRPAGGDWRR